MSYTNFRCVDRKFKGEEIIVRMCVHSPKNTKKNFFFLVLGLRGAGGGMNHEIGRGKEKEKEKKKKRRNKEEFEYYMTCM